MSSSNDEPKVPSYIQSSDDLAKISGLLETFKANQDTGESGKVTGYEADYAGGKVKEYEVDYASDTDDEEAQMVWAMAMEDSEDSGEIKGKGKAGVTKHDDIEDSDNDEVKSKTHTAKDEEDDKLSIKDFGQTKGKGKANVTKDMAAKGYDKAKGKEKADVTKHDDSEQNLNDMGKTKGKVKAINPKPSTPPAQPGPKEYLSQWGSPDSQVIESGDCSPSQEGVWRKDRPPHAPPAGKLPPGAKLVQGKDFTPGGKPTIGAKLEQGNPLYPSDPPASNPALGGSPSAHVRPWFEG